MPSCIFCQKSLGKDTRPEHVLLDALGGRKTTTKVLCSDCNNRFGATIDKTLAAQFSHLRSMFHFKSGTGKNPPGIKIKDIEGRQLLVRPDGNPEHMEKPFIAEQQPDGRWKLQINARSPEHLDRLLPDMAASMGMSLERLREQLLKEPATEIFQKAGILNVNLNLDGEDVRRSIVKQCLTLWATKVGNEELHSDAYLSARAFAKGGEEKFSGKQIFPDYRDLPDFDSLVARFGPIHSTIVICSDSSGRVVANFNIYNSIGWHVVLATGGGALCRKAFLVSNSLDTANWSNNEDLVPNCDTAWLDQVDEAFNTDVAVARFSRLMSHYKRLGDERELQRIFKEAGERYGLKEGNAIPPEALKYIAERYSYHLMGVPLKRVFKII